MGFLSNLLPGLRDLRTPLAVGVAWAAVAAWFAPGVGVSWLLPGAVERLRTLGDLVPATLAAGLAAAAIYVLGSVMMPMQNLALHWVENQLRNVWASQIQRRRKKSERQGRAWCGSNRLEHRVKGTFSGSSETVVQLLTEAGAHALTRAGVPATMAGVVPGETLSWDLDVVAPQLAQVAPDQAQHWDRLETEAEFRRSLVVPVTALLVVAGLDIVWLALPLVLIVPPILLGQSYRKARAADRVLATAVYLGMISHPVLASLQREIERTKPDQSASDSAWLATAVLAARHLGHATLASQMAGRRHTIYGLAERTPDYVEELQRRDPRAVEEGLDH